MTLRSFLLSLLLLTSANLAPAAESTTSEIDAQVWAVVSATVAANDIGGMAAVYHPDAVLVHGKGTVPIAAQMVRWGEGMAAIEREGRRASVSFRFKHRLDDGDTAFESGLFRYSETDATGVERPTVVPFEALLVKKDGAWLILMERQYAAADEAAWAAAMPDPAAD